MKTINLENISQTDAQHFLQSAIAPRPICFASTINKEGLVNLSPFSFFNLFSYNPPIVIFSPVLRGRDGSSKHTLENLYEVPEVVINTVSFNMVQQMSLSSCEFPRHINEFEKTGFTMQPATLVQPPMVAESKVKMECRVNEIKSLGKNGGAGNLVIAEVLVMHVEDDILDEQGKINQQKLSLVARLGGDWYTRVDEKNLFRVAKPNRELGIGLDELPESIRQSSILTGNDLGQLANVSSLPVVDPAFSDDTLKNIVQYYSINPTDMENELHRYAQQLLVANRVNDAWQVLLALY